MRIESSLKVRDAAKTRLSDLHAHAAFVGMSSSDLTASYLAILADLPAKTPAWVRHFLEGYHKAALDSFYATQLVFGGYVDGVFYSTVSYRADYYAKHGISPVDFAVEERVEGRGHYWDRKRPYRGGWQDRGEFKLFF